MHRLLKRQYKRFLEETLTSNEKQKLEKFLAAVSEAYQQSDDDRNMIERSLELMSDELTERNAALQDELKIRQEVELALRKEQEEQQRLIKRLEEAHNQLVQSDKLASIGQLAAGVAHEINNPIGYINTNITSLKRYVDQLIELVNVYGKAEQFISDNNGLIDEINKTKDEIELDYLVDDVQDLMQESIEGIHRVKQIVQDLKDFSHVDQTISWEASNLHAGLDSTLNVASNELKYKAEIIKNYGDIPYVECIMSQLNQVFLNILVNSAHAIKDSGTITITTYIKNENVVLEFADTGSGIPEHIRQRIFDPFFTTKPIGEGTGLGLSLSFGIITKHNGTIDVVSEIDEGTTFIITLPVEQPVTEKGGEIQKKQAG